MVPSFFFFAFKTLAITKGGIAMKLVKLYDCRGLPVVINADEIILIDERFRVDEDTNIGVRQSRILLKGKLQVTVNMALDELMIELTK